ncbi:MAG: ABC transporter ATP-binding protein [Bacteroides stercoris]
MIELQHFSIGYKENSLLHEVNATIKKGQLTALIGRNGTGRSTLLRAIAGLNRCYSGKIILDGHYIACMKTEDMAKTLAVVTTERMEAYANRTMDKMSGWRMPACDDCSCIGTGYSYHSP